ncbi:MAG TPA: DNA gyrase modulator, partial [Burkholderiaceae bacterium]|nr:DNA gyrase modulator [Burkholderiaceae bacterium]
MFEYERQAFEEITQSVLRQARELGASAAATDISESSGLMVNVRKGSVETIEQTRDKGLGVTIYLGTRRGHSSTSDFSAGAVAETVRAAYDIARFTGEDPFAGLPEPDTLARQFPDLDLFHPWRISVDDAIALAQRIE